MTGILLLLFLAGCGGSGASPSATASASASPSASASAHASASPRPPEVPGAGDHKLALTWDGRERTYEVHAPPSYRRGTALPLVVVMHYANGNPGSMRAMTRFDAVADRERFLVAYPVGLFGTMNALACCGSYDDVGFVRTVVTHLIEDWGADPARVYATGISNGADMAFRLAVDVPGMFAAIAPVSGGFVGPKSVDPAYKPSRKVSVVSFVGRNDLLYPRALDGLAQWNRKVGCTFGPATASGPVRRAVARCRDRSEVVSYTVDSMGHAWPGGTKAGLGDATAPINATEVMWTFFKAHPRT